MLQVISVLGAMAILLAYAANQFRFIGPENLSYALLNFIGSFVLAVIAVIEVQWGFILLEGVWALVSLWGIVTILRDNSASSGTH
jgi:membrane-bound ClpP family serine protease